MVDTIQATWEMSLRVDFDDIYSGAVWECSDPNDWSLSIPDKAQIPMADRIQQLRRLPPSGVTLSDGKDLIETLINDRLLGFLADGTEHAADQPQSVVCNYLAGSRVLTPMRILSTIVNRNLTVQIQDLPEGYPCWFYIQLEKNDDLSESYFLHNIGQYLLAFPSLFLSAEENWLSPDEIRQNMELMISHRMLHTFTVLVYENNMNRKFCKLKFRDHSQLAFYPRGRICSCIPIAGKCPSARRLMLDEPLSIRSPEVVFSSPTVARNLKQLSDIWQDKFANSVLVTGPPGSGKESISQSVPYGSGRASKGIHSVSLAVGSPLDQQKTLFGTDQESGIVVRAKNGALVVDEAHYPTDGMGIRASLLRAIESREYTPIGCARVEKIDNVMWIFTSSLSLKGLSGLKPLDFWTRMSHVVEVHHPLDAKYNPDRCGRRKMLRNLFKYFWWDRVESFFDCDPAIIFFKQTANKQAEADLSELLKYQSIRVFLKEQDLDDIAEIFEKQLEKSLGMRGSKKLDTMSVRGIRSIVSRMFSMQIEDVLSDKGSINKDKFRRALPRVIEEIRQIASLSDKSGNHK